MSRYIGRESFLCRTGDRNGIRLAAFNGGDGDGCSAISNTSNQTSRTDSGLGGIAADIGQTLIGAVGRCKRGNKLNSRSSNREGLGCRSGADAYVVLHHILSDRDTINVSDVVWEHSS